MDAAVTLPPPLCEVDVEALSQAERIEVLAATERQLAQLAAAQQRVIASLLAHAEASGDVLDPGGKQWVREDVAAVLKLSGGAARARMANAETLTERLTDTLALLERGDITLRHALTLVDATNPLDDATAAKVQARVLPRAPQQSVVNFRASVERAVIALDERGQEEAHQEARAQRRVDFRAANHGMTDQFAHLPAEDARTLALAVQTVADREAAARREAGVGDTRSADQKRADALVALAQHALDGCPAPLGSDPTVTRPGTEHGRRAAIQVTVALSTLLGHDDQPGELDGHGPITAGQARRIAFDPTSTWYRLLTDPAGRLLDYGQTRYRPPQALVDHVTARDRGCRFPHCRRRARRCEIDHVTAFGPAGGGTCVGNLAALCPRHHHLKHDGGWTLLGGPEGRLTWISPTAHRYISEPEPLPLDQGSQADDVHDIDDLGALDWTPTDDLISAADRAEADIWLDDVMFAEVFGQAAFQVPDWLTVSLGETRTATMPDDDPPPF